ncbi:kynurenine 3-monooxygenase, mitochondrial precursor [Pseudocyphellaria aurata]|nr:kynurenine 3-monooxygenase, mitochondrial precursor [Pseudocyphellaria aurata]
MHGRMIHKQNKDGKLIQESQKYDAHGRYIQAVDRAGLNKGLLDALDEMPNVTLYFNHKLTGANFNSKTAWFEQQEQAPGADHAKSPSQHGHYEKLQNRPVEISVAFDLLIGADGAHSAVRHHMMKYAQVAYQQEYIDTLWCEFRIEPKEPGPSFAISPDHLHIWPGRSFMFIAIPSLDKSFTCTLFASSSCFLRLSGYSAIELQSFFAENFPGVCPELIPTESLEAQFSKNPHLPLISIKCAPHHYKSSVVILGDAAHAMVPFYGQGMNAGLEDVRVLFEFLDKSGVYDRTLDAAGPTQEQLRATALDEYTKQRTPDAATINDLALRNYEEMRSGVQSPLYRIRKWVEESVSIYFPRLGWKTQYSRVSFENERYSEVERAVQRQGNLLVGILGLGLAGLGGLVGIGLLRSGHARLISGSMFRSIGIR